MSGRYHSRLLYYPPENAIGRVVQSCDDMLVLYLIGEGSEIGVRASECVPYLPRVSGLRPRLATVNGIRVDG
jgi:hypothetical protein